MAEHEHVKAAKKAVDTASTRDMVHTLSTGVRVRFQPVSAQTVDEATMNIEDPPVPRIFIQEEDREIPNPDDPGYKRAVTRANAQKAMAALDVVLMLGLVLEDGVPEDDGWLGRLKWLEKRGRIDLSEFDLGDPYDREYVYKRHLCVSIYDIPILMKSAGVSQEAIALAERNF